MFDYIVVPLGLTNTPAILQLFMNYECLVEYLIVYLDDLLLYSFTEEDHERYLQSVFHVL